MESESLSESVMFLKFDNDLGRILSVPWAYLGHIFDVSWVCVGHILSISWAYIGHILLRTSRASLTVRIFS